MKELLKRTMMTRFPRGWMYRSILFGSDSYLSVTGWRETVKRGYPCRADGSPLPWMNYAVIALLEERLAKDMKLFEFGSGYSTLFYADLAGTVTAVENDRTWHGRISEKAPPNVNVLHVEADVDGDYCRSIHLSGEKYDVVIVDGRDRVNCFGQAMTAIAEDGVVLLDDSFRDRYAEAHDVAREQGFAAMNLRGLKPQGISMDQSTLYYRRANCLRI
jgi:hypothetical protein